MYITTLPLVLCVHCLAIYKIMNDAWSNHYRNGVSILHACDICASEMMYHHHHATLYIFYF